MESKRGAFEPWLVGTVGLLLSGVIANVVMVTLAVQSSTPRSEGSPYERSVNFSREQEARARAQERTIDVRTTPAGVVMVTGALEGEVALTGRFRRPHTAKEDFAAPLRRELDRFETAAPLAPGLWLVEVVGQVGGFPVLIAKTVVVPPR